MSSMVWCDDLDAPNMGIADRNWWDTQSIEILHWLKEHGGNGAITGGCGIIFVPNEEIKMLFILRWL